MHLYIIVPSLNLALTGSVVTPTSGYYNLQVIKNIWIVRSNISRIIGKLGNCKFQIISFFSKIRDPGCRGSIRLVKTVCLNQFSDFIIIKIGPKIKFYIKFGRKSTKFHVFHMNLITRFVGYVAAQRH